MPLSILRFNGVLPDGSAADRSAMYRAFLDMAEVADINGFFAVNVEEHHGVDDGWLPAPLIAAGLVLGHTSQLRVLVQALLLPLNDPIRVAEQVAVLDLASGGRLSVTAGLGYRQEEYAAAGVDWSGRGAVMDASLEAVVAAWTGEPFEWQGRTVQVTPTPMTPASGLLFVGGSGRPAARRAARLGLPLQPAAHLPDLQAYYEAQCREHGTSPMVLMPPPDTHLTLLAADPVKAWDELGGHLLHEAGRYRSWQTSDVHSAVASGADTVAELRAEGIYEILTPDELTRRCRDGGDWATVVLHPFCGGIPVERAWETVNLYIDEVLPALA